VSKRPPWKDRKYHWIKHGQIYVCEGEHGVSVGCKEAGYSVFSNKNKVQIPKDGNISYIDESGYMGIFQTRKEALDLLRQIDTTFSSKGDVDTVVVSNGSSTLEAFSQSDPKTGGTLLFYPKGDIEGQIHEQTHYLLGHHKKRNGRPKFSRTGLRHEKKVVETQIRWHRLREEYTPELREYTPELREEIIKHLATYFKGGTDKDKEKRARKFVKSVE